ncbi:uncharacterized protein LOC127748836 [Frankliniella occidentalis]|uniref:Uncharacterized protein LOC127748836 n=1 Tax=Frankliniella occidentalis TaxID=133901 RepID=A0A9C6TNU5_FRAOC|nr:uncharacterized protein LOC127748836 [Frankliniella occidentalis]
MGNMDPETCTSCKEKLPIDYVTCSQGCVLHFNTCAGLAEGTWRKMSNKSEWKCPTCRKPKPTESAVTSAELRQFMNTVTEKLAPVQQISGLKASMEELKNSVDFMSSKYDEVLCKVADLQNQNAEQAATLDLLKTENEEKEKVIEELKIRMREAEQYARNRNIEISGVEFIKEENLITVMENLAEQLQIRFKENEIDVIHRVPSRYNGTRPPKIIVQFTTRKERDFWLKHKKYASVFSNDITNGQSVSQVYLDKHLTAEWKHLLWQSKQVGRPKGYKIFWHQDSKICVKKNINEEPIIIRTAQDLQKLN